MQNQKTPNETMPTLGSNDTGNCSNYFHPVYLRTRNKKYLLNLLTAGGYFYYQSVFPHLQQKPGGDECVNVSSPFRRDRNPSFQIKRNPSTNVWHHYDYGSPSIKGDMYDLAARLYKKDIKTEFAEIMHQMLIDLGLDKLTEVQLEEYDNLSLTPTGKILHSFPQFQHTKHEYNYSVQERCGWEPGEFTYKQEGELSIAELDFLKETSISFKVMEKYKAFFIDGYCLYSGSKVKNVVKPNDQVWIAYPFSSAHKIYCPNPKKFWWVGKPKSNNYIFGTPQVIGGFEKEEVVFLTGGEKDVLSLLSRGYNAMCLNSETKTLNKSIAHSWYFDAHYDVVVLYDNDQAGIENTNKLKGQFGFKIATLPTGVKDITEFFIKGGTKEEFDSIVKNCLYSSSTVSLPDVEINYNTISATDICEKPRLRMRTAMQRLQDARLIPDIKPYFDVFFHSNELAIFFGDTGIGKSIFAVGLADAISKGESFMQFENYNGPTKVLYYDFELTDKQFEKRYKNKEGEIYPFSDNLLIDPVNFQELIQPGVKDKRKLDEKLFSIIEQDVIESDAKVIIIDNITYLSTETPEDTQIALNLMQRLTTLKKEKSIAILVLAHTPKKTSLNGITVSDLAGSKHLANFADSLFALGKSKNDPNLRYIKQIKSRSAESKYSADNVPICELVKEDTLLTFQIVCCEEEAQHLCSGNANTDDEKIQLAKELKKQGKTVREIAEELNLSKSKVGRWVQPE